MHAANYEFISCNGVLKATMRKLGARMIRTLSRGGTSSRSGNRRRRLYR